MNQNGPIRHMLEINNILWFVGLSGVYTAIESHPTKMDEAGIQNEPYWGKGGSKS